MKQHFGQFRSIELVCPGCQGTLQGTGRVLQNGHVFRCGFCQGLYRWYRSAWRQLYGFNLIEQARPVKGTADDTVGTSRASLGAADAGGLRGSDRS